MDQGWDSPTTVMGYIQEVELFDDNALQRCWGYEEDGIYLLGSVMICS